MFHAVFFQIEDCKDGSDESGCSSFDSNSSGAVGVMWVERRNLTSTTAMLEWKAPDGTKPSKDGYVVNVVGEGLPGETYHATGTSIFLEHMMPYTRYKLLTAISSCDFASFFSATYRMKCSAGIKSQHVLLKKPELPAGTNLCRLQLRWTLPLHPGTSMSIR